MCGECEKERVYWFFRFFFCAIGVERKVEKMRRKKFNKHTTINNKI